MHTSACSCRGQSRSLGFFLCCCLLSCLEMGLSLSEPDAQVCSFLSLRLAGQRALRICLSSPSPQCWGCRHLQSCLDECWGSDSGPGLVEQALVPTELSLLPSSCLNFKNKYFEGWDVAQLVKCLPTKHRALGSIP